MQPKTVKLLHDVRASCLEIEDFTSNATIDDMWDNRMLQLSLHKLLEIIGEALNQAARQDPKLQPRIPDLRRYVALRNQITHGYGSVDYEILWRVSVQQVPRLRRAVDDLLTDAPDVSTD